MLLGLLYHYFLIKSTEKLEFFPKTRYHLYTNLLIVFIFVYFEEIMAEKTLSLADQAYEKIKDNIMDLTYPPGMSLTEAQLTRELGMSRSPVRSAIQMLQTEGLIESDYYKTMTVKNITKQDIHEIYQLRELIESSAFRYIFTSKQYEEYSYRIEEKVVRMCAAAGDVYKWEIADTDMHMEIIRAMNNERINRVYENTLSELIRIGQFSVKNGMHIPKTNENLKKMVQYMRTGNYEKSFAILKADHFEMGKDSALKECLE